jgi:hypothetical protein
VSHNDTLGRSSPGTAESPWQAFPAPAAVHQGSGRTVRADRSGSCLERGDQAVDLAEGLVFADRVDALGRACEVQAKGAFDGDGPR